MNRFSHIALALGLAGLSALSQASTVTTSYSLVSGNTWQVDLSFSNSAGDPVAPGLSVYFDEALYANLANAVAPAGWDPLLLQPDVGLAAAGVFDVYAFDLADALQPGQTQSGFSVQFSYLGTGAPGTLSYEFYRLDGSNVESLGSGSTVPATVATVPEPATLGLGGLALAALVASRRRAGTTRQVVLA